MDAWKEDRLHSLLQITSEQDLFKEMTAMAVQLGFEYCAYGIRMPVPVSRPAVLMFNNYAEDWQESYRDRGYLGVDPTVRHALKSTLPLIWSDNVFNSARDMWEDARSHGLEVGWAQASRDATGSVGLLTLARSGEALSETELIANQARMSWFAQYAHAAMSQLVAPRLAPENQAAITAREKEVLLWTAEGKTAYEISQILNLSERTVNFHVNNVVQKLGSQNKTQAAVKAIALGLLL